MSKTTMFGLVGAAAVAYYVGDALLHNKPLDIGGIMTALAALGIGKAAQDQTLKG